MGVVHKGPICYEIFTAVTYYLLSRMVLNIPILFNCFKIGIVKQHDQKI